MSVCAPYTATSDTIVPCGPIHACPGDTIEASGCSACSGDQLIFLYNGSSSEVTNDDDGCSLDGSTSYCSYITYTVPYDVDCQDYVIGQSCFSESCSGTITYGVEPPPSRCPAYSATSETSAFCGPIEACPGDIIEINGCGGCTGDQLLILFDNIGSAVDYNDDACADGSLCSSFSYGIPSTGSCQNYTLGETCFVDNCSGNVTFKVESPQGVSACSPFSATPTDPVNCGPIYGCAGDLMEFSGCDACTGDEKLNLYDSTGAHVGVSSDGCGSSSTCAVLSYIVPAGAGCQYYALNQGCTAGSCSGTTSFTVGPAPESMAPTLHPTAMPVSARPTNAATAYVEFYSTAICSGAADLQGVVNDNQCVAAESGYIIVTCDPSTSATAWVASYYDNSMCSGTPLSTATGSDPCACTTLSGMNLHVNCAGVPPGCSGGGSSSDLSSGAVAGIVVGSVGGVAVIALAAAYFMGFFKATTPLAYTSTHMDNEL